MKRWSELKYWQKTLVVVGAIWVVATLLPLDRSNPPVTAPLEAPPEVDAILRRACYDCHSNETTWPWWSYVAPSSFLVTEDVAGGRHELNFSHWGEMEDIDRVYFREQCWEEIDHGDMPPVQYTMFREKGRLTDAEKEVIRKWAEDSWQEEEPPEGE